MFAMPKVRELSPNISDAEWDVIKVIWDAGDALTAGQIVAALEGQKHWRPRTIKTLLARLVKKGAVRCEIDQKRYVYRAALTRQQAARREARSFLSRVFDGALVPAVVTFLKESDLSPDDVQQLKQILDREARP
jgi:BlaI family transcriptional regulator, penicillinase repressor